MTTRVALRHGACTVEVRVADTLRLRLFGLLGSRRPDPAAGLLLVPCGSVHMFGMRHALDIVFLDRDARVLRCVPELRPWRAAWCPGAHATLELAPGAIDRLQIRPGMSLPTLAALLATRASRRPRLAAVPETPRVLPSATVPAARQPASTPASASEQASRRRARGAGRHRRRHGGGQAIVEFAIVVPVLLMLLLALIETALLMVARNTLDYAAFEAARVASVSGASASEAGGALMRAMLPLYGGHSPGEALVGSGVDAGLPQSAVGRRNQELREFCDAARNPAQVPLLRVERLNPSAEAFTDWGRNGVIEYLRLTEREWTRDPGRTGRLSSQTLDDALVLKLKVSWAYTPKTPVIGGAVGQAVLPLADYFNRNRAESSVAPVYDGAQIAGSEAQYLEAVWRAGKIPLSTIVTLRMAGDARSASAVWPLRCQDLPGFS